MTNGSPLLAELPRNSKHLADFLPLSCRSDKKPTFSSHPKFPPLPVIRRNPESGMAALPPCLKIPDIQETTPVADIKVDCPISRNRTEPSGSFALKLQCKQTLI